MWLIRNHFLLDRERLQNGFQRSGHANHLLKFENSIGQSLRKARWQFLYNGRTI